jgi:hypothetical protein
MFLVSVLIDGLKLLRNVHFENFFRQDDVSTQPNFILFKSCIVWRTFSFLIFAIHFSIAILFFVLHFSLSFFAFVLIMFASMIQMSNKSVRAKTLLDEIDSLPHEINGGLDIVHFGNWDLRHLHLA